MIKQVYSNKPIQLLLRVDVDGVQVYYSLIDNLRFRFWVDSNQEAEADAAVRAVVSLMCEQSFDHWKKWVVDEYQPDNSRLENFGQYAVVVQFRIRDSY